MIIYHFIFDLMSLGLIPHDLYSKEVDFLFPRFIVFLFFIVSGASKSNLHTKGFIKLALACCLISFGSMVYNKQEWIFFGTLHCLLFSWIVSNIIPNKLLLISSLISMLLGLIKFNLQIRASLDLVTPFPWLGYYLLGKYLRQKYQLNKFKVCAELNNPLLVFLSKHSLFVYIVHQPILISLISTFMFIQNIIAN